MGKSNRIKDIAQTQKKNAVEFNEFEQFILNPNKTTADEIPHVNMKYYTSSFQCFSAWSSQEMKQFSDFIEKLRQMKWADIYRTGGKLGYKTGLGYSLIDRKNYPKNALLDKVSADISFFELRVNQTMRVHGFRCLDAFYLVYLDRNHDLI